MTNAHKTIDSQQTVSHSCQMCGLNFTSRQNLDKHMNWIHQKGIVVKSCDIQDIVKNGQRVNPQVEADSEKQQLHPCTWGLCKKVLESKGLLKAHLEIHKKQAVNITCEFCDDEFSNEAEIQRHIMKEHSSSKASSDESFTCNDCLFQTSNEHEIIKHLVTEKHQPSPSNKLDISNIFKCHTCKTLFSSKYIMMGHRKNEHPSNKVCRDFVKGNCLREESECSLRESKQLTIVTFKASRIFKSRQPRSNLQNK